MRQTSPRAKPVTPATAAPSPAASRPAARRAASASRSKLSRAAIATVFERLAADRPEPRTELAYTNPFTLIVAVLLSAQATDVGVNKATARLFAMADNPAAMLALGEDRVRDAIRTIGLFRNKAKNVIELSRLLLERHGGMVPANRDALEALPGVGRKTANVVLNEAFGEPTIAVDTHIFRVANRTGLAPGKTPAEVEALLERLVPKTFKKGAHHWLILHGRYVCKARKPECWRCVIADLCRFEPKTPAPSERIVAADEAG
jgi:endonuclease III